MAAAAGTASLATNLPMAVTDLGGIVSWNFKHTVRLDKIRAYEACGKIHFANAHHRRDITWRALK